MVELIQQNEKGSIIVSRDVLATIAAKATLEVEGVLAPQEAQITDFVLAKKYRGKPFKWVKVEHINDELEITVSIEVKHGLKLINISKDIQHKVKQEIETMTGLVVSIVNIDLLGVKL
jgi:uncharacterized alkaline shock family protein YloU